MDLVELAEHTEVHLLPRFGFEEIERHGCVLVVGNRDANLHPYRVDDVPAAVAWGREEGARRSLRTVEWWVGWRAQPADLGERLLACGLTRSDDPFILTGMTCRSAPPAASAIEVRRVETSDDYRAALEVDWGVWGVAEEERVDRRAREAARFEPMQAAGSVHHFSAFLDGRNVGFGRAIDMAESVALFGGAVLPEARRQGVYRALVRARWEHAVGRGTPALVVQAGPMSAPVLDGLGFERNGEIRLYNDVL
jgi:ribosomal protein S18 acetylase RimI-like enzyme